jgi:hypothetical protein
MIERACDVPSVMASFEARAAFENLVVFILKSGLFVNAKRLWRW